MATPPRITDAELAAALERIARRHARIDDPRRSAMGSEPRDVLDYLAARGAAGIPRWVAAADTADALVLHTWCWWDERRREHRLLRTGRNLGLSLAELGAPLGITTRRGTQDRLDRLDALLKYDRPDEQLTRTARREHHNRDARQVWIDEHRDEVCAVLAGFLAQARRFLDHGSPTDREAAADAALGAGDDPPFAGPGEWLDELAADYAGDAITPATLAVAGLAAAELRAAPAVLALDQRHRLHAALREIEALRARYAGAV
ncbi:hypothetical protein [Pseudonocardia acidicola]|uniref:Uncharacterized protein n=1 Tax=Pseudonocardia acidicola TaxID=2724939 RepID=A0ABX1S8Z6_9PSEU|nr:hypothetical protein [Pseudonocardia acidicola]NMH97379.1 hypothetical protein [Pseudonocardia acidicola]